MQRMFVPRKIVGVSTIRDQINTFDEVGQTE